MKALVYHGPYDVRLDDKPKPKIQHPEDAILRVTSTAICGSDLHLYHGKIPKSKPGQTLGHEFMGIIEEVGPEVHEVKEGDRVVIPFNISCGKCWYCRHQLWSQCDRSNPNGAAGAAFGYGEALGGYDGGQAEYVRVPYANTGPLKVPDDLSDDQVIFLSDILATGYYGADIAGIKPGDDVAVFGAGPVGYFAVLGAFIRGAARVVSIDHWKSRLEKTKELGAISCDFSETDPVQMINELTNGNGMICIDCVGFEAIEQGKKSEQEPNEPVKPTQVFEWMSKVARKFSTISVPGVYQGMLQNFPMEMIFNRELQIRTGQCPVKRYNDQLLHLIEAGRIDPSKIITDTPDLDNAVEAYEKFDKKESFKTVLKVKKEAEAKGRREAEAAGVA